MDTLTSYNIQATFASNFYTWVKNFSGSWKAVFVLVNGSAPPKHLLKAVVDQIIISFYFVKGKSPFF